MDKGELARRIRDTSLLTGTFKLRSGRTSDYYWDKYRFESDPVLLGLIAEGMEGLLPTEFDRLAGLELGGVPLATALSLRTGKRALYVRKEAKTYGTCNLMEGGFQPGDRAVVIEDVITSGGQVCESVEQIRALGLTVEHVLCAIDRQQGGREKIESIGCTLTSLLTQADLDSVTTVAG